MCNEIVYLDKPADQSHDLSKQRPSNMNTSLFLPQIWRHLTLRWCFYKLSFWRHPFTAEHPLLSDATLHFSKSDEETNSSPSCMTWGWARFQQSYSFKAHRPSAVLTSFSLSLSTRSTVSTSVCFCIRSCRSSSHSASRWRASSFCVISFLRFLNQPSKFGDLRNCLCENIEVSSAHQGCIYVLQNTVN